LKLSQVVVYFLLLHVRFWLMLYVITHGTIESFCQVQCNEVIKVPVEIKVVVLVLKEHHPSQDSVR
jgi:hypothetical protein